MHVIQASSGHDGLYQGMHYLAEYGVQRGSRNGGVLVAPGPVTTAFTHPMNPIVWYPERDYNIAFLVYESLWMLDGRTEVAPLAKYVKRMKEYSDDGKTLRGSSYGHRWREHFDKNQLELVANRLVMNKEDRRSVLGMWDPRIDLVEGDSLKDLPCNMIITFQVEPTNETLDMTIFCRSNDILWGTYFANAFHFSMLLHYMSWLTKIPMGTYYQVSVNYHAYSALYHKAAEYVLPNSPSSTDLYQTERETLPTYTHDLSERMRKDLLRRADEDSLREGVPPHFPSDSPYYLVLYAHEMYRHGQLDEARQMLVDQNQLHHMHHWVLAMDQWLDNRQRARKI